MKKLNEEKLEEIVGGAVPTFDDLCKIGGWAFAVFNGSKTNSLDFQMDAELFYVACILSHMP
jgi:bacteriocin-like protein